MVDKEYLKKHLRKHEELETAIIRYNALLNKDDISSPAGKTGLSIGGTLVSAVENAVCKKIIMEEKIERLEEDLARQLTIINSIFEKLENPYEKIVMQMRYEDRLEWDEIRGEIFGNRRDYSENIEKYNDRVFRIHGAALKHMKELQRIPENK